MDNGPIGMTFSNPPNIYEESQLRMKHDVQREIDDLEDLGAATRVLQTHVGQDAISDNARGRNSKPDDQQIQGIESGKRIFKTNHY